MHLCLCPVIAGIADHGPLMLVKAKRRTAKPPAGIMKSVAVRQARIGRRATIAEELPVIVTFTHQRPIHVMAQQLHPDRVMPVLQSRRVY